MEFVALTYILTFLIPINGLILLGMINERKKIRKLVLAYWKLRSRG